jgi:N-acetylglucosaminyldiphosphoundecaprenol N-acetyl-beta-D-mannosaminyltransferase
MTIAIAQNLTREAAPPFARASVLGVRFDVCDYRLVVQWLRTQHASQPFATRYVCVSNVADVMTARGDHDYAAALAGSDLTVPDGAPIVWALRDYGQKIERRVYGPTLMQAALDDVDIAARRHVLVGGTMAARAGVRRRFAHVNWVGELDFRFDQLHDAGYRELASQFADLQPDYAWVSLGGGKQVKFMHRFASLTESCTLLGVGAAFDFHAGLLSQAPVWMQERGFEWLYRLAMEPGRLWHRYLVLNPPFLWYWFRERTKQKQLSAKSTATNL